MRILLVEDDALLGDGLVEGLAHLGIQADWARTAASMRGLFDPRRHQALVLDLGLPDRDGTVLLEEIRQQGARLPVIVLTARDAVADKVDAFALGADDYVIKPVAVVELAARLSALVRRSLGAHPAPVVIGELKIDLVARRVWRAGIEIPLSGREFAVLEVLAAHRGRVLTRRQIEESIYDWEGGVESNALAVFLHNLRRKLGKDVIQTLRGIGYMLGGD